MKILITICARGGSKGIPGKNIKPLGGKPLIAYTIDTANKFKVNYPDVAIALSSDSEEIRMVASNYGLETDYIRPEYLGGDSIGKIEVINDILLYYEQKNNIKYDFVLDMDVTSPLRNVDDLEASLLILKNDTQALNLFSVSDPDRNPYFNMVEQKSNGYYFLVKKGNGHVLTRQSAPNVYSLNASFYFYTRHFFDSNIKSAITNRSLIYKVPHICFDLDHPLDFEFMSYLIENKKLDFEL